MPPASSLAGILDSPAASSNGSAVFAQGRTLPDISLGSLGSSFHSESDDGVSLHMRHPESRVSMAPKLPTILRTPSPRHLPVSELSTVRRASSQSVLVDQQGRPNLGRLGYFRSDSISSASSAPADALELQHDGSIDDDARVLGSLSINVSPGKQEGLLERSSTRGFWPNKRSGRHSVAANNPGSNQMTLREQEQSVDALQKENFNLQLENHFLKERLASMAPDHIEAALNENVKLKIEILNMGKELKKAKKLLIHQDRDLAAAAREREESEKHGYCKERGPEWNSQNEHPELGGVGFDDRYHSIDSLRAKAERLESELDSARASLDDQAEEVARIQDSADRAHDELQKLRAERDSKESVGFETGQELRKTLIFEQEKAALQEEIEELRTGNEERFGILEDQLGTLRDKLASSQLDLDRRDQEIDELNAEIDTKVQEHEVEIQEVEAEWRNEVLEARAQIDELKDVLQEREQDLEVVRKALLEREDELIAARERIAELDAVQGETHDRLEDTLRNIELDNAEKNSDLMAAIDEVEILRRRVLELEEVVEEFRIREGVLRGDLQGAEEAFESTKVHYEDLVSALKEARRKAQVERDDSNLRLKRRANQAANNVMQLESRLAELQTKCGLAENKWEARVKEYESRLRVAGEKIKTEKQGGKERAMQLEAQVRDLQLQLDSLKKRNQRAENVVKTAAHLIYDQ